MLATFWPELEADRARSALRASLHLLRRSLGPEALGKGGESEVALDPSLVRVDYDDLTTALESGDALQWLAKPSLELVPGLHVPDAPPFMEWLDAQRLASNGRIVRSAWELADRGDSHTSLIAARAATRLAREDEVGLRRLISLLDQHGDRAGALAEFDAFRQWCETELEASPAPETVALVQHIRDRTVATVPLSQQLHARSSVVIGELPPVARSNPPLQSKARRWRSTMLPVLGVGALLMTPFVLLRGPVRHVAARDRQPIAVLPFQSKVTDTALAYVAPALGESIADALGFPAALPYEAMRGADTIHDPRAVHTLLVDRRARAVVRGAILGDRDSLELQIVVSMVNGDVLQTARWRAPGRRFAIVRDSAVALIRDATGVSAATAFPYSPKPEAVQLEWDASHLLSVRTLPAMRKALDMYNEALVIDPDWPELWLGRSRVYGSIAYRHGMNYRLGMYASEHDATEVLKRNGKDARAYIERAMARFHLGDMEGARTDAQLAAALDSSDFHMQSLIGTWWQWTGDHLDSALFYTQRAERLARSDRQTADNILEIVGCMPDSAAIIAAARQVLEIDPRDSYALETLAWTLTRFGGWKEAADVYEQLYPKYVTNGVTAPARRVAGEARFRATVRALRLAEYRDPTAVPPAQRLVEQRVALFEDLGMRDSSIAALASVVDSLEAHRTNMMCGENLRAFRHDPHVREIVRRRGWIPAEFARDR